MTYKIRVVNYEPWLGDPAELVTMAEAAEITGLTLPGLTAAMFRGELTEIINEQAQFHGRRCLLRSQVMNYQVAVRRKPKE